MIAAESQESCTGSGDSGYTCTSVEPFLKMYAACRAGTQSGNNIQNTVCTGGDSGGCDTTTLDGTKCYAPAASAGTYVGTDITGTVPGFMWNFDADRAVVGWSVNPAYGPIPTMRLSYARPLTTVTATDRWDDQCPALAAGGRCTVSTAAVCTDGPATKVIDGVSITRDCWEYTSTMTCTSAAPVDQCAPLAAAGCTPTASMCKQTNIATGTCEVFEDSYSCPVPAQTVTSASNCPSNVFCLEGSCFNISSPNDSDFARSMSLLEAGREAGVYIDSDRMQVFKGEDNRCRDRLLKNCCYSDGAGAGMTNQSLFGSGSRLVYDVLMNAENRQFLYQGMSALLTEGGLQRQLHHLWRHRRRERRRDSCWLHRGVFKRRHDRRLRSLVAGYRSDHLHHPVDDVVQRGRRKARDERRREALPHDRHLVFVMLPRPRPLRVLRRAHHLEVLLQLDARAHRQRTGSYPDRQGLGRR